MELITHLQVKEVVQNNIKGAKDPISRIVGDAETIGTSIRNMVLSIVILGSRGEVGIEVKDF